ncbi:hypothetical protein [Desulfovibrio sp. JC010]|uniref:hypothetical protein n=1 Tax=Desulfovibrio sp. JC010 TaxID=2593641 RepID=UPI0013D64573|nr:hypothetical protein [Desulfovibrio sp. JC010]NDV27053.1 hypothetical protein [Desulfovibrio sp. JC010]
MRFATFILLIALFIPTNSWAQSILPLSCDDVTKIEVWRFRGKVWYRPKEGYHYPIIIYLTEKAQKRTAQVYKATEKTLFMTNNCRFFIRNVQIKAQGKLIQSADPTRDNFRGDVAVIITKKTKEAAFEAARLICPSKVPTEMLTDGS